MIEDVLFPAGLAADLGGDIYAPAFELWSDGVRLSPAIVAHCTSLTVSQQAGAPSSFSLQLHDPGMVITGPGGPLREGTRVQVRLGYVGRTRPVVTGRVRAVAAEYPESGPPIVTLDGYDALHDLTQRRLHAVFAGEGADLGIRDSDVVARVCQRHDLRCVAPATEPRRRPRVQANVTDLDFLNVLARDNDRDLFVDTAGVLHFTPFEDEAAALRLTWGRNLQSFGVRRTDVGQVDSVQVRVWSPAEKDAVVGAAPRRSSASAADGRILVVDSSDAATTDEADRLAAALYARRVQSRLTGHGSVPGNPDLRVGRRLQVSEIGDAFSGPYIVTSVSHRLGPDGFTTGFEVTSVPTGDAVVRTRARGGTGDHAASAVSSTALSPRSIPGVVPGIISDAKDPSGLARVKVRLPVLGADVEVWARLAVPLAGPGRGTHLVPRIDDEVLVAFEHGDPSRPYVVGSLWSETDRPPPLDGDDSEAADVWSLRTAAGHRLTMTDTAGAREVGLVDGEGNGLVVDTESGTVRLRSSAMVVLESPDASVTVSGADVAVKASGTVTVESAGDTTVTAIGTLTQKGAVVRIN